jgi:hypothetical protein
MSDEKLIEGLKLWLRLMAEALHEAGDRPASLEPICRQNAPCLRPVKWAEEAFEAEQLANLDYPLSVAFARREDEPNTTQNVSSIPAKPGPDGGSDDGLDYARAYYGVPAKIGGRVKFRGKLGRIVRALNGYPVVSLDHCPQPELRCHPTWEMEYLPDEA